MLIASRWASRTNPSGEALTRRSETTTAFPRAVTQIRGDPSVRFATGQTTVRWPGRGKGREKRKRKRKGGNEARRRPLRKLAAVAAAAILPKLLSASLDGAAHCTRFESKWPHRDNASRKWGRVIKALYNRSSWAGREVSRCSAVNRVHATCRAITLPCEILRVIVRSIRARMNTASARRFVKEKNKEMYTAKYTRKHFVVT